MPFAGGATSNRERRNLAPAGEQHRPDCPLAGFK
jgi:hypothetical protein